MVWNVCCSHSWFCNAIVFRSLFGTCTIYKKTMMPKIGLSKNLQINIGCLKICQSNFISTNRQGKNTERCINTPPLNTPLSHVVTKCKGVWSPRELLNHVFINIVSSSYQCGDKHLNLQARHLVPC